MSQQRTLLHSRHSIESCTFQLNTWRPFLHLPNPKPKTLNPKTPYHHSPPKKPYPTTCDGDGDADGGVHCKRHCRSDRATSSFPIDEMSKLTLFDDDRNISAAAHHKRDSLKWIARKRRRRGSRSVSGRSSDRSGTRRRCCSVGASAAYATCSDFPVAAGTDSSGELFLNGGGEANWASDVSEATRRERDGGSGSGERENLIFLSSAFGQFGILENQGNDSSGYGSEPGYRGDAEFGYGGDEIDEEEDDPRLPFWGGDKFSDADHKIEMVGENTLQKAHHRCRRKKQDLRMIDLQ